MQTNPLIWHNGKIKEWRDFAADSYACLAMGDSCITETVPGFEGPQGSVALFRILDHAKRFLRSAKTCFIFVPYDAKKLADAAKKLQQKVFQQEEGEDAEECLLEMRAFSVADQVHVVMQCWPVHAGSADQDASELASVAVGVSSWRRSPESDVLHQACAASACMEQGLARREVRLRGCDEPIVLNTQGHVADAAGAAVFAVRCGVLSTPPLADGPAESIARDSVLHLALDLEIPLLEESLTRADLYAADELFLASDADGVVSVHAVDGCPIGKAGECGPITKLVFERFDAVKRGNHPNYGAWTS